MRIPLGAHNKHMSKINEAQIFLSYRLFNAGTIALALRLELPVTLAAQNQAGALFAGALLTLLYRARRGRSLLVAHAEHLYQIPIISGWSHARIALTYWLAIALCGAIGWVANRDDTDTVLAVALAILVAGAVALDVTVRRRAEAAGILKR